MRFRMTSLAPLLAIMLTACAGSTKAPDIRVPLPEPPERLQTKCDFPHVSVGQDAVHALYQSRASLKTCEGKRRDWQKFDGVVRSKR